MGLVSHEAPRLTDSGPVPYDDTDAHRPLETGMVVSIETTMKHPTRGFIKLEDTVAVTPAGYEIFGQKRPRLEFRRHRALTLRCQDPHGEEVRVAARSRSTRSVTSRATATEPSTSSAAPPLTIANVIST